MHAYIHTYTHTPRTPRRAIFRPPPARCDVPRHTYTYVHTHAYTRAYVHTHTYMHVHMHMHIHIHIHVHLNIHIHIHVTYETHTRSFLYSSADLEVRLFASSALFASSLFALYVCTYIELNIYIYICIYTHIYIYIYIHIIIALSLLYSSDFKQTSAAASQALCVSRPSSTSK